VGKVGGASDKRQQADGKPNGGLLNVGAGVVFHAISSKRESNRLDSIGPGTRTEIGGETVAW
jgi:hypothetical protein